MKSSRIFWGVALLLWAFCLIFNGTGLFDEIGMWSIIVTIAGAVVLVEGLIKFSVTRTVIGASCIAYVWKDEIGLEHIGFWTLVLATILIIVGLNILLQPLKKKRLKKTMFVNNSSDNVQVSNKTVINRSFSGGSEFIRSKDFQRGDIDVKFSGLKLYFNDAVIIDESATLHMNVSFSSVELYVPCEWAIDNRLLKTAANVEVPQNDSNIAVNKTLKLKGDVNFGSIKIIYV